MLRNAGFMEADAPWRIFSFIAMSVVIIIPVLIGMNFFVIPGIILAAKWIMSPVYLVANRGGLFSSMGDSWHASSGNTLPISLAFTVLVLIWLVIFAVVTSLVVVDGIATLATPFLAVMYQLLPVLLMGLAMATYRLLNSEVEHVSDVFA